MAFPRSIDHSPAKGLALFADAEADRCSIKTADKVYSIDELGGNSTFRFWIFKVRDSYQVTYEQYIEKSEGILHTITVGDGDEGVGNTIYEALNT